MPCCLWLAKQTQHLFFLLLVVREANIIFIFLLLVVQEANIYCQLTKSGRTNTNMPTPWEVAKPVLERDCLEGRVTDSMARKDVHAFRPEFQAVPINNFGNNWNRIKKSAQELKRIAVIDSAALFHDKILHPVEHQNRWDGSDAQTLLKQDIELGLCEQFSPKELWLSRPEHQVFDLDTFRPHVQHLAVQLHHFRQHALDKKALVEKIATTHQRADVFAKALPRDAFRYLRRTIIGW